MRNEYKLYCRLSWQYRAKKLDHQFLQEPRKVTEYFGDRRQTTSDRRHRVVTQWRTVQTFTAVKTSYLKNDKCIGIVLI